MSSSATLITCLRNEAPFLIEWLAYHKAIGFDRIIIGANDCTDGSHEMLTRLAELGEIIYLPFTSGGHPEGPQYQFRDILESSNIIAFGDWIMWMDLDEFLVVHLEGGTVHDLSRQLENAAGIHLNWRIFGCSDETDWPGSQVHPTLCTCAPKDFYLDRSQLDHRTFKSLYRYESGMLIDLHGPVLSPDNAAQRPDWRFGNGKPMRRNAWPRKRIFPEAGVKPSNLRHQAYYGWGQINHYATRHPKLQAMRRERGVGSYFIPKDKTVPGYKDFADRYSPSYFKLYAQYSSHEPSILKNLTKTEMQAANLLSDRFIKKLHLQAQAILEAQFKEPAYA